MLLRFILEKMKNFKKFHRLQYLTLTGELFSKFSNIFLNSEPPHFRISFKPSFKKMQIILKVLLNSTIQKIKS